MTSDRRSATSHQLGLAHRLGKDLPEGCNSHEAARILDPLILKKSEEVMAANPALRVGKVIMYEGTPKRIAGIVDKFKFALQSPSGGRRDKVWIIDVADCQEVSVES